MSLATRCSACGTVFRVVQDQLKVSEGWVRCGRCDVVFNALESLFDLQREGSSDGAADAAMPSAEQVPSIAAGPAPAQLERPAAAIPTAEPISQDKIDARVLGLRRSEDRSTPATRVDERDRLEFPDAQFDPELLGDANLPPDTNRLADSPAAGHSAPSPAADATPGFMRASERATRWHQPTTRAALLVAMLALLAALLMQGGHHFRDLLAARWSATRPPLLAWCDVIACALEAPRRIDDVVVQSTALTRADLPDSFNLSVALRNRSTLSVAMPSIDLSLTDPTGQLVARRVLTPRDFRVASSLMPAGGESTLQTTLTAGSTQVTGYTVEVFYP